MMGEVMMKYDQWQVMNDETQKEFDAGGRRCDEVRNEDEEKTQNEIGKCILGRCN